LPRYATAYCEMLADYVREIFPITRPTAPTRETKSEQPHVRRVRQPDFR
jgi:LysR family nitrogen assimilation transcriptional regulator